MHDIAVVVVLLSACAAIGWPLCLLLPDKQFGARFVVAPPIGFGLFAIGATVLYLWGVRPWISMMAMAAAGFVLGAVFLLRRRPLRLAPPSNPTMAFGAGTVAVILICLLPGWTGGSQFRVFQANVYDQMTYLGASASFRTHDYASITAEAKRAAPDPIPSGCARRPSARSATGRSPTARRRSTSRAACRSRCGSAARRSLARLYRGRQESAGGVADLVGNHGALGSFELEGRYCQNIPSYLSARSCDIASRTRQQP